MLHAPALVDEFVKVILHELSKEEKESLSSAEEKESEIEVSSGIVAQN